MIGTNVTVKEGNAFVNRIRLRYGVALRSQARLQGKQHMLPTLDPDKPTAKRNIMTAPKSVTI